MLKNLKICGERIPVKYKDLEDGTAGIYDTDSNSIHIDKSLPTDEHDETLIHEMVHAVQFLSTLRHANIHEEVWEIIAGEVGKAVSDNFILIPKK